MNSSQTQNLDEKAIRLVNYLLHLAKLRVKLIRDIAEYQKILWVSDIPHERDCFTQAWGRDEEHEPDEWLEIQTRREPELPKVPAQCEDWVDRSSLRNKNDLPKLLSEITWEIPNPDWREGSNQPEILLQTEYIVDHPEFQQKWERYIEDHWLTWKEEHDAWENVHKVYSELFAIHQEQLRLGEEYELVLGLGLLTWQTPSGQRARRHLVVADAILEFEACLGKFTVRPHTEGAKLRPELDMLDIEEQPARAEETAKESLAKAEDDPWEKDCVEGVLQALVNSINPQGVYEDSLETKSIRASAKPIVEFAPALILRKRSAKGFTETLKRIKEQIEEGIDIPGEFADLAEIRPKDDRESPNGPEEANAAFDGEIFFPKPSNDEQRRIVDKIRTASGVLVQGPPGTGKSHTIANLICHLLATGQRTLITAKTPRALQVLEGLVPNELRPLCINLLGSGLEERRSNSGLWRDSPTTDAGINLLGSGLEERRSLESSVDGILRKYEEWSEDRAERERRELGERLQKLREEKARVNQRLRDIRESETHTQSIAEGAYRGTAARIAEAVNRNRSEYEWFTDSVPLDKTCQISTNDLRSVLVALRQFTFEKRRELSLAWPEALFPFEHFDNLVKSEIRATEKERFSANGADEKIAGYLSTSEAPCIERLLSCLLSFRQEVMRLHAMQKPWIQEAIRDVSNGDTSLWLQLTAFPNAEYDLRSLLVSLRRCTPVKRQELQLVLPDRIPSKVEIKNLFEVDKRAAEEEELCLRDGADKRLADHFTPRRLVCGSCREPLDYQSECDPTADAEHIVACPHCGKRNRVRFPTIRNSAQTIHDSLSVFRSRLQQCLASNYSWMKEAVREITGGNSVVWTERCRATRQAIILIEQFVSLADETTLDLPASANLKGVFEGASMLKDHTGNGGKLGWWPFRTKAIKNSINLLKAVRINGHRCSDVDDFSRLCDVLQVRLELDRAWEFWLGVSERTQGPYALQLTTLKSICNALENALLLEKLRDECIEVMRPWPEIPESIWHDETVIANVIASCRLALVHQRQRLAADDLQHLEASLATWSHAPDAHPVTGYLLQAIRERDTERFVQSIYTVDQLKQDRLNVEKVNKILKEIASFAPRLAKELELTHNDPVWDERIDCIGDTVLEQVLRLPDLIQNCKDAIRLCSRIGDIIWSNESEIERHIASCTLALARQEKDKIVQDIRDIEAPVSLVVARSNPHPVVHELLQAIRDRHVEGFAKATSKIQELERESQHLQKVGEYLSKLRLLLPQFTKSLEQTCNESYWEERIQRIGDAWHWAQARYWIEHHIRQEDVPALAQRTKQIEDEINSIIAKLASLYAWSFCFSRLKENHRRHMEAWQQSMRGLGKGTGKHAPRHRRAAQGHLNKFREAVPAWVMPLHRVWDTVHPAPGMFDVIIVDEASQCGVEALPLFYLGKKILIVGDDKQISPDAVGLPRDSVHRLMEEFLHDFHFKSSFDIESSLFDHGKLRYGTRRITLREHFRCMPEIIRFSNDLCYSDTPLIPLRQYGPNRLPPLEHVFVREGYREGLSNRTINRPEAEAIVARIANMCGDSQYNRKTMGVVVLQGEAQAALIENQLLERLGAEEMGRRRLVCGNPYGFQGDERDIMFLSLVAASNERIGPLTKAADERRFNVAASRARDMMILFHSVTCDDLSVHDLRRRLLEFFENTKPQSIAGIERDELERRAAQDNRRIVHPPTPFESWFEVDVALELLRRNFTALAQYEVAGKRIDLVVEGGQARLAVECDGDNWHGPDRYEEDMQRQRQLERCGWEFFRVRESAFYTDKNTALKQLWSMLEERGIFPGSCIGDHYSESNVGMQDAEDEQDFEEYDDEEDDDRTHSDDSPEDDENDVEALGRRVEEVTIMEIQNAIINALSKCPNQSCTVHSIASCVLKEIGIMTRGNPRKVFERRVMRCLNTLEGQGIIEKYKAKNNRIRLLISEISQPSFF